MVTETEAVRVTDNPFAEVGLVTHEGRTFAAYGAVEHPGMLAGYVVGEPRRGEPRHIMSWDGSVTFGRIIGSRRWKRYSARRGTPYTMEALTVRRPDGSLWVGRYGSDWSQLIRLRPKKGAK